MILWFCAICIVCIIAGVIYCKPYLGIVFVIISIPFEGCMITDSISIYPIEVVLAIVVFVLIPRSILDKYNYFGNTRLLYCCIPFVLYIVLSSIKSIELSLTVKEIVRWIELFLVYYLTINLTNDKKKMRVILYSMFLTVAIVSVLEIIHYLSVGYSAILIFDNPNPLAGYINLIVPVILGMLTSSTFFRERITLVVVAVVSIMAWLMTFSKAAWLALLLTVILACFLTKAKKRAVIFLAVLFTVFTVFTIILLFLNIKGNYMFRSNLGLAFLSLKERAKCYSIGFDIIKDNLILGIGVGNWHSLIVEYVKENAASIHIDIRRLLVVTHIHSLYLHMFVEMGIVGFSAFVFWLVCIIKYLMRSLKVLESSRHYGLFVGLMGGIIVYLFNNLAEVLVVHGIHLQWGIILGLAVVLTQFRESETCPKTV
jgi:O-antigen ligase